MLEYRKLLNNAIQETERDKIFHVGMSVKKDRLPEYYFINIVLSSKIISRKKFIRLLGENPFS